MLVGLVHDVLGDSDHGRKVGRWDNYLGKYWGTTLKSWAAASEVVWIRRID